MTPRRYFSGSNGTVATSAVERCGRCSLPAAFHARDIEAGRDRLLCPSDEVIARINGEMGAIVGAPNVDRLGGAMELSKALYGEGPTVDQSLAVPYVPLATQLSRRAGKTNAIRARMKSLKLSPDEKKEFSRLLREEAQREVAEAEKQLQQQQTFEAKQRLMQLRQQQAQRNAILQQQFAENRRYVGSDLEDPGRADYFWMNQLVQQGVKQPRAKPAKPAKPAQSVTVGTPRAYFEDE